MFAGPMASSQNSHGGSRPRSQGNDSSGTTREQQNKLREESNLRQRQEELAAQHEAVQAQIKEVAREYLPIMDQNIQKLDSAEKELEDHSSGLNACNQMASLGFDPIEIRRALTSWIKGTKQSYRTDFAWLKAVEKNGTNEKQGDLRSVKTLIENKAKAPWLVQKD